MGTSHRSSLGSYEPGLLQFRAARQHGVLVLQFGQGELRRPGGRAALHVGRILLELNRRGTDIEDQDHTSPFTEVLGSPSFVTNDGRESYTVP